MTGVINRVPYTFFAKSERALTVAAFTEYVTVIPGDPDLRDQRHQIDVVLCQRHDGQSSSIGMDLSVQSPHTAMRLWSVPSDGTEEH